jgi:hypothetical protein
MTALEPVLPAPQLAVYLAACQLDSRGEDVNGAAIADLTGLRWADCCEALDELRINGYLTLRPAWRVRLVAKEAE